MDRLVPGFGVRVTENGQMSFVLTYGPNRTRVKLGEVGLYDPQAGVGKVKGLNIVVADAAKLVGKKVRLLSLLGSLTVPLRRTRGGRTAASTSQFLCAPGIPRVQAS